MVKRNTKVNVNYSCEVCGENYSGKGAKKKAEECENRPLQCSELKVGLIREVSKKGYLGSTLWYIVVGNKVEPIGHDKSQGVYMVTPKDINYKRKHNEIKSRLFSLYYTGNNSDLESVINSNKILTKRNFNKIKKDGILLKIINDHNPEKQIKELHRI